MSETLAKRVPCLKRLPQIFRNKLDSTLLKLIEHSEELDISEVYLFGSCARGDYDATSDIDFLILTQGDRKRASIDIEMQDIRDEFGYPNVDIVVRSKKNFNSDCDKVFYPYVVNDLQLLWQKGCPN